MLASLKLVFVLQLAYAGGLFVILALLWLNSRQLRRKHPLPQELKTAGLHDRLRLGRWAKDKSVAVDPDLARAYLGYIKASMPLRQRDFRLFNLWAVYVLLGGLVANPVAHPELAFFIALGVITLVWVYVRQRRLERLVARAAETG